jgi:hypothetical protein
MTLLNAPEFDEKKETRRRSLLIGSGVTVLAIAVIAFAGFALGHGWMFMNLPAEHRVSVFLAAVEARDYGKAYGIFNNDANWQQHPEKYKDYPLERFTQDFSTESDWKGPVNSYHVDFSKRDSTGTVVAATINGSNNLTLKLQRSDGTLSFFPYVLTRGI